MENCESLIFSSQNAINLSPENIYNWLDGSHTSSSENLLGDVIMPQQQLLPAAPQEYPLSGRDGTLEHIAQQFNKVLKNRSHHDRNKRPLPVCTGIPGLGKSRICIESIALLGKRCRFAIISFGNDGNAYGLIDKRLGIQCSFAWRVLHSFFKSHHNFEDWMTSKSPINRADLTLRAVLATVDYAWRLKAERDEMLNIYVGIDEYQVLDQSILNLLLDSICNNLGGSRNLNYTFFSMLAGNLYSPLCFFKYIFVGTDLNKTRVARTTYPNTVRVPINFLSHSESVNAILPFIKKVHPAFVVNSSFSDNVALLGGVPRILVKFSEEVVKLDSYELSDRTILTSIRQSVLSEIVNTTEFSRSDLLELLATSFTNTRVKVLECPFQESSSVHARTISWNHLSSIGLCLILADNRIIVPFHLVASMAEVEYEAGSGLSDPEKHLCTSLKELTTYVENSFDSPNWSQWEWFGACFYCIRINSFLVLRKSVVTISQLLDGSKHLGSEAFQTKVELRVAKLFHTQSQFSVDINKNIPRYNNTHLLIDWVHDPQNLWVILNGDNGKGVDIFFSLRVVEDAEAPRYFLICDQRKRLSRDITQTTLSQIISKAPPVPKCVPGSGNQMVLGIMSIYSDFKAELKSDSVYMVSRSDSERFHGSLFHHPGCSIIIDVNTAPKESLGQIIEGTRKERNRLVNLLIQRRDIERFADYDDMDAFLKLNNGTIKEEQRYRIFF